MNKVEAFSWLEKDTRRLVHLIQYPVITTSSLGEASAIVLPFLLTIGFFFLLPALPEANSGESLSISYLCVALHYIGMLPAIGIIAFCTLTELFSQLYKNFMMWQWIHQKEIPIADQQAEIAQLWENSGIDITTHTQNLLSNYKGFQKVKDLLSAETRKKPDIEYIAEYLKLNQEGRFGTFLNTVIFTCLFIGMLMILGFVLFSADQLPLYSTALLLFVDLLFIAYIHYYRKWQKRYNVNYRLAVNLLVSEDEK